MNLNKTFVVLCFFFLCTSNVIRIIKRKTKQRNLTYDFIFFIYAFGDPDGAGRTIASLLTTIFSTSIK